MNFKYFKSDHLIIFIIGATVLFGAISTFIHHWILALPSMPKNLVLFTDTFTVPFFITILMHFINTKWWSKSLFKWLIDIPNLNGRYLGIINSSYTPPGGKPKSLDCVFEIKQNATSIHISAYFGNMASGVLSSSSISVSEELVLEKSGFHKLYYIFTNETGGISQNLNNHSGTAKLFYYPDKNELDGVYYNVLGNSGTIKVTFQQKTLLGRLVP